MPSLSMPSLTNLFTPKLAVAKPFLKLASKVTIYGLIALGTIEVLRGGPSVRMMKILIGNKKAWDPRSPDNLGIVKYTQLWCASWWHCTIRAPSKYVVRKFKALANNIRRSYIGNWISRKGKKDGTNDSDGVDSERVSAFQEMFDRAVAEAAAESARACFPRGPPAAAEEEEVEIRYW
ncbi:uncharacterized protein F4812DRAFT_461339 [Daldinia caldariorum]|uniref:uncharacterized protein n=1 Tax=Daldinia caldariorum TaxID=326644 RepID=UPI0020076BEC|nr:uncharacterized protein F4812DRAFT_461339 [Daldinia caldariorum]KAI1465647.1 hypothetical protein F4812DRAFT_461339 [Daldinia caldariorum]